MKDDGIVVLRCKKKNGGGGKRYIGQMSQNTLMNI